MKVNINRNKITFIAGNDNDSHYLTNVVKKMAKDYRQQKSNVKPKM